MTDTEVPVLAQLLFPFWPFASEQFCSRGCGHLVQIEDAVGMWSDGTPLGWAHAFGECPT